MTFSNRELTDLKGHVQPRSRADAAVLERGWAPTRSKAAALLLSGNVLEDDDPVTKAGRLVYPDKLRLREALSTYVGRGGDKLASFFALHPELSVSGLRGLDIGASTGGFTDFCLQHGATSMVCVDVGTNQLDWKIRNDPRVSVYEKTDIRKFQFPENQPPFDFILVDVSFISLTKISSVLKKFVRPNGGNLIALIKPQFEVGKGEVGKGGIVRDERLAQSVVDHVVSDITAYGFTFKQRSPSGLKGTDGNQEYFAWFIRQE